jgi:hypothetical protein
METAYLNIIKDIEINELANFLINNKWTLDSTIPTISKIYHNSEYPDFEIVLPDNKNVKGYLNLITSAFLNIKDVYSTSIEKTINALGNVCEDTVKIRIIHDDVKYGTIQLDDGLKLINGAREMMSSSANSVIQKRKLFVGKMHNSTKGYVDHLRLGQTEIGSYIINVYSEIRKPDVPELFEQISYDRKVSMQLINSMEAMDELVEEYEKTRKIEVFDEAVNSGISANFCKSIIDLSGSEYEHEVKLEIQLNESIKIADKKYEFEIPTKTIPILQKGYDYLVEKNQLDQIELIGFVFKLSRDEDEESGVVNIATMIDDKTRKVRVYLSEEQYEIAISAHRDQKSVIIKGDLKIETRKAELTNVKSILLFDE